MQKDQEQKVVLIFIVELKASLGYMKPCIKKTKQKTAVQNCLIGRGVDRLRGSCLLREMVEYTATA